MIEDTSVPTSWVNAHTIANIAPGVAITIQPVGAYPIRAMIKNEAPAPGVVAGNRMLPNTIWATALGDTVWLKAEGGTATACIQEA
ncbi:MAG: hypothetical protein RR818_00685 [Citrobacter sp.]